MVVRFDPEKYKKYIIPQQGGKLYLTVIGALKAAIDNGVVIGSETTVTETDDMVRVHVRVKAINKHIEGWSDLPESLQVGYYDGVADNPKVGGKGAARAFPLEDAETSAMGRALTKIGYNLDTMATADEMKIVEKKKDSGYVVASNNEVAPEIDALKSAARNAGLNTVAKVRKASQERFSKDLESLTTEEVVKWTEELKKKAVSPVPSF